MKYIQEKKASPIFLLESIKKFERTMAQYNSSLIYMDFSYKLNKVDKIKDMSEQTKLF